MSLSLYLHTHDDNENHQTRDRGWALRTTAAVPRGTRIIEYLGEVVTMDVCQARMGAMTSHDDYYFASLAGQLLLDAGPMGSDARFAK